MAAAAAIGVGLVGTGVSVYGQMKAGRAEEAASEYNAQLAEQKAFEEETASRERLKKLMARQRALYAKAGVDIASGSPLLVLADTRDEGEDEAMAIRYGGSATASQQRFMGRQARRGANIGATGTFLTGLGQAGINYYGMKA